MFESFSATTTLLDFYDGVYQPAKHAGHKSHGTRIQYRVQIGNLNRFFRERCCQDEPRDVTLGDLCDELLEAAMNWTVESGWQRSTANKLRRHINAVWKFAARSLAKRDIKIPRPENSRYRENLAEPIALLPDEFARVLSAAQAMPGRVGRDYGLVPAADWFEFYIRLSFNCGGRVQAMRGIPTRNLDLVRGEVLIPAEVQKQAKDQRFRLLPKTIETARRLRLPERAVPTLLGDWHMTTRTLRDRWAQLLVDAELYLRVGDVPRELKLHAIRKTFVSTIAADHGEHVACDIVGHSTVSVTRRYIDKRYLSKPSVPDLIKDPEAHASGSKPALRIADVG